MTTALDTSVAIPLLLRTHRDHADVVRWWSGRPLALAGHALAETYSVLTRLPPGSRFTPEEAARLMAARFGEALHLAPATAAHLPTVLAGLGVAGGATYDALVALAARDNDAELATRDARARDTYERVGVRVVLVG